jgi:hypothetical protein
MYFRLLEPVANLRLDWPRFFFCSCAPAEAKNNINSKSDFYALLCMHLESGVALKCISKARG